MMMPSAAYAMPVATPAMAVVQPAVSFVPVQTYNVVAVPQVAWQPLLLANMPAIAQQPVAVPTADAQQSMMGLSACSVATLRSLLEAVAAREAAARAAAAPAAGACGPAPRAEAAGTTGKTLDGRVSDLEKRVGIVERAMDDLIASVTAQQGKIEQLQRRLPPGK
jgi:hypothetical protein